MNKSQSKQKYILENLWMDVNISFLIKKILHLIIYHFWVKDQVKIK